MNAGPFREQRPGERKDTARPEPEPTRRSSEETPTALPLEEIAKEFVKEEQPRMNRPAPSRLIIDEKKSSKRKFIIPAAGALLVIILILVGIFIWKGAQTTGTAIDSTKYQAVFFTNGQVYFGKLKAFNTEYLKMTDIYYLQTKTADSTSTNPQTTSNDSSNVQLIKLGDEIHGPEDEMVISKSQVLFYENLKTDGQVAKSIDQYKAANK